MGVRVLVGVRVIVGVRVFVGVLVIVGVRVTVGVRVGVRVFVEVRVFVGVRVACVVSAVSGAACASEGETINIAPIATPAPKMINQPITRIIFQPCPYFTNNRSR